MSRRFQPVMQWGRDLLVRHPNLVWIFAATVAILAVGLVLEDAIMRELYLGEIRRTNP